MLLTWFRFFTTSIGKKLLMSFTGLALSVFLLTHVLANLLLLVEPALLNEYAHSLATKGALLYLAEAGLLAIFVLHVAVAIQLTRQNRNARPEPYVNRASTGRSRRWWASSNMLVTGVFTAIFLVIHLWNFKWGTYYSTVQNGVEMRDLSRLVIEDFQKPWKVAFYVVAMILIWLHLLHGFRSAFETLGLSKSRFDRAFLWGSRVFVYAVMGGFILIPLVLYFNGVPQ